MAWVTVDDRWYLHPKMIRVGPLGMALQMAALCYCAGQLTDGYVPASIARRLVDFEGMPATADQVIASLVANGVWDEEDGGYRIHDYLEYQRSREDVLREREAAKERMRSARQRAGGRSGEVRANIGRSSGEVREKFGRSSASPSHMDPPDPDPDLPDPPDRGCVLLDPSPVPLRGPGERSPNTQSSPVAADASPATSDRFGAHAPPDQGAPADPAQTPPDAGGDDGAGPSTDGGAASSNGRAPREGAAHLVREVRAVMDAWNRVWTPSVWKMPLAITPLRRRHIVARLRYYTPAELERAARNLHASAFHRGEGPRGWRATPEWLYGSTERVEQWLQPPPRPPPAASRSPHPPGGAEPWTPWSACSCSSTPAASMRTAARTARCGAWCAGTAWPPCSGRCRGCRGATPPSARRRWPSAWHWPSPRGRGLCGGMVPETPTPGVRGRQGPLRDAMLRWTCRPPRTRAHGGARRPRSSAAWDAGRSGCPSSCGRWPSSTRRSPRPRHCARTRTAWSVRAPRRGAVLAPHLGRAPSRTAASGRRSRSGG